MDPIPLETREAAEIHAALAAWLAATYPDAAPFDVLAALSYETAARAAQFTAGQPAHVARDVLYAVAAQMFEQTKRLRS